MTEQTATPPVDVTVNALQASDYAAWQRLGAAYNRFYEREFPLATYERTWQRLMQGDGIHGFAARVARARGAPRLYWLTRTTNARARRLYDRVAQHHGFIRYDYAMG